MKTRFPFIITALVAVIVISCNRNTPQPAAQQGAVAIIDKGFSKYITAYTSGTVPASGIIQVVFNPDFAATVDRSKTSALFSFSPAVKGTAEWVDDITLVFKPARPLTPATAYSGSLNLGKLGSVEEKLRFFPLAFRTVDKNFTVTIDPVTPEAPDGETYSLTGTVVTSDFIDPDEVEEYITAKLGKHEEKISWSHDNESTHLFRIEKIKRGDKDNELTVSYNGNPYGIKTRGDISVIIPAAGIFRVTDVKITAGESKSLEIYFSDLLDPDTEFDGLVTTSPAHQLNISAEGNKLLIIPADYIIGEIAVNIDGAVRNSRGEKLGETVTRKINFTPVPPGIGSAGKGVIMPSSGELIFPFMAANLSAVDVTIIKIFENNLPYFLQQNSMGEAGVYSNVREFGRPVWRGRVDLTGGAGFDPNKYNLFTVNLADYIEPEPGILYRIEIGMRPSYSLYPCKEEVKHSRYEEMLDLADLDREWEGSDNYYSDTEEGLFYEYAYNWHENSNPCNDAYYSPYKKLVSNILASDLGLMAKNGTDNSLRIFVNDIQTAMPVEGATAEVYDYQMQLIGSVTTDKSGIAAISCPRKPYLVIARKDKNRNYLSLNDGLALSMSSFDVSGEMPQDGIRAFLYTERDVRRPGDSIFVGLIVKDIATGLPEGHPVHFELYNPMGQRIDDQVTTLNAEGFITFATVTSEDAVTGNYKAQVRIGGAIFSKTIKVETVKPNRLKIKLTFPYEIAGGDNSTLRGSLNAAWLNGATAGNLKSTVELLLKPVKTTFEKYGQYRFDDPVKKFWFESQSIFDGNINSDGDATFSFTPDDGLDAPGMLNAVFTTKVFEKGGDASINQTTLPYAPYPAFVGMNIPALGAAGRILFTDKSNEVRVVTVDKNGKAVRSEVEISVYKLDYRWWWESDNEYLGSYISRNSNRRIFNETITTSGGEGKIAFTVGKQEWGRYLVRATLPSGHSTGMIVLIDWPWDYGMKPGGNDGASMLQLNTDKDKYNVGDEISLTFPSPENGQAIITIENSTGLLDITRVSTNAGTTEVKLSATKAMAPNAYLYVTLLQPHSQTVNDAPIRLYGVMPVMVEDPGSRLKPVITMADKVRSQQEFEIKVTEENKQGMTYTLAVVDEGLLDLTGFRTPDPWKWFFVKHALGVKTWDLYDLVFGAFGGKLGRLLAAGGDEAAVDQSKNRARRFEPVVRFIGPFTIGPGKTGKHTITLPQYTGAVRVMVVAAGEGNSFGSAEKSVIVSDPLMVLATAPRVLSPGDRAELPVAVFAQDKAPGEVTVTVSANDMITPDKTTETLNFSQTGEKDVSFYYTTALKPGKASINVSAEGGGEKAAYDLNLEVRVPNPPERRAETMTIKKGEKFTRSFPPFGLDGTSSASLEIFSLPPVNLTRRLGWLTSYPYGCSEQVTSAAFPQVYLPGLLGNNLPDPSLVRNNVQEALRILASRQLASGAITLWPGGSYPDDWVTSYAGHFAIEAGNAGYALPAGFLSRWTAYQKSQSASWRYQPQYRYTVNDQAYRLFTLALAGSPDKGAMNRLRETADLPSVARWFLAAAYATTGRTEVAQSLIDVRNLNTEEEYYPYYYGSRLRDRAIILYTLTTTGNSGEALELLKSIAEELSQDRWYSTQTTAWGLFSYMNFARATKSDATKPIKVKMTFNGKDEKISSTEGAVIRQLALSPENNIDVVNEGENLLFVTFTQQGVPENYDNTVTENNLGMKVEFSDMALNPLDVTSIPQGTGFIMTVTVTNTTFRQINNIALTEMVPAGWEIENTRLFETNSGYRDSPYDYRDFRDDRVYTYFSLKAGETRKYYLNLTAAYRGTYYMPSVTCEAMYDNDVNARRPGGRVTVTETK